MGDLSLLTKPALFDNTIIKKKTNYDSLLVKACLQVDFAQAQLIAWQDPDTLGSKQCHALLSLKKKKREKKEHSEL